jgi:hypothetical protein
LVIPKRFIGCGKVMTPPTEFKVSRNPSIDLQDDVDNIENVFDDVKVI